MKLDLSRYTIGQKQESGVMGVYPILGADCKYNLASFEDVDFEGTVSYGEMSFSNNSEFAFILPSGYAIISKQLAQDHALPQAEILAKKEKNQVLKRACCVQQTQCGYLNPSKSSDMRFLPLHIRKNYLADRLKNKKSWDSSFSRLWGYITSFQDDLVKEGVGNLVLFFNKYMEKLSTFNAEFEYVEGQIGAIITINDEIVGIEIAPNAEYFKTIWNSLIRDCYGSEIIRRIKEDSISIFEDSIKTNLVLDECKTLEDVINAVSLHSEENKQKGLGILKDVGNKVFSTTSNKVFDGLNYSVLQDKTTFGETFIDEKNNELVYLSLIF